jgi:hypothetical protein
VFALMLTPSLEQTGVAYQCLKARKVVNHQKPW